MEDYSPIDILGSCKGEKPYHFAALVEYAQMGRREGGGREARSLRKLAESSPHKFESLCLWSVKFGWQKRVEAYDIEMIEQRAKQWADRRLEVDDEDYQDGAELRELGRLQRKRDKEKLEAGDDLGPGEGRRLTVEGSKLQRLATGAPTETTEVTIDPTIVERVRKFGYKYAKDNPGNG